MYPELSFVLEPVPDSEDRKEDLAPGRTQVSLEEPRSRPNAMAPARVFNPVECIFAASLAEGAVDRVQAEAGRPADRRT